MSADTQQRGVSKVVLDRIIDFIHDHDDPGVTVADVADGIDCLDHESAKYRLQKLANQNRVYKKKTGASAAIWFPKG